ncbi:hypothetical protein NitYY0826_C0941 [Nitratiruptor sp. YY08-26]|uniref:oligosaccharide flippase family protein n=1 Tax=unclassified Nitratiruptor TaxID=2624044 RepID=UPI001916815C|nr:MULTISPECIES: oligosaccharide flippase family protein [unclassified Nitratiruptor]BCD62072.1 hypothetical protein NitYY0813_C0939 [Nitratiruptor sp. YY08-13]BCD66008.1 hypothetical protein NitYY0826_C0941 [Nitratiruptor sp. YY08-26]
MNRKEYKIFKKNIFYSAISFFLRIFVNVIIFLFIAKADFVKVSDFGLLNYAIGLGIIFTLLSDYGIETYAIRDIAAGKIKINEYSYIFSFRVFLSIISFLLFLIYCLIFKVEGFIFVLLIVISFYFNFLTRTVQLFFQAVEKFYFETKSRILENLILIFFIFLNIFYFKNFILFGWLFFISRLLGFLYTYNLFKKEFGFYLKIKFNKFKVKKFFFKSFSFALLTILPTFMVSLDVVLIKNLIKNTINFINTQIAYYSASVKLFVIFTFIAGVFQKALLPQLSRLKRNKELFFKSIHLLNNTLLNFNLISAIFIFIYAKDIITLLYSQKYIEAVIFVKLVAIIIVLRTSAAYCLYFTILDFLRIRIYSSLILLILFLSFSFYFIPKYNGIGALFAMIIGYIGNWIYIFYQIYKRKEDLFLGLNKLFTILNCLFFYFLLKFLSFSFLNAIILSILYLVVIYYILLIRKGVRNF